MTVTLREIVDAFLADEDYLNDQRLITIARQASRPEFHDITLRFIDGNYTLEKLRDELQPLTRETANVWFAQGRFMMEINKLSKNHIEPTNLVEERMRNMLFGLNAHTLGERIEELYQFLLKERERLRRAGKPSNAAVAPGNSALIMSLFAAWLDSEGEPTLYNRDMREGMFLLHNAAILPQPVEFNINANAVEVDTETDHNDFQAVLQDLLAYEPRLKVSPFWSDFFLHWVSDHLRSLVEPESLPVKEIDESSILDQIPAQPHAVKKGEASYTLTQSPTGPLGAPSADGSEQQAEQYFDPGPLQLTPEPLLTRLIREVQRSILVDEAIVRRIYHALLAGHVILTGPPGTGKTELARLIPETLWRSEQVPSSQASAGGREMDGEREEQAVGLTSSTAYTTRLVTATDDWSVRTLIGGIMPQLKDGAVAYKIQHGHLTATIMRNWVLPDEYAAANGQSFKRSYVTSQGGIERGTTQQFRGLWLVIDEFNRAPIDLALGDALTALGGHDVLRVIVEGGSAELPIPQDFRIIGTLNSFDRSYLNQISEALKRRFSFVELLPPGRAQRAAEQGIVLYKALKKISHLSESVSVEGETITWGDGISIDLQPSGRYAISWLDEQHPFRAAFEAAWSIFEVIRIYRQLGTAQAISLVRALLIAGLLQDYTTSEDWIEQALDAALCDTIADQLQVLLPDEVETLFLYLTSERGTFAETYNRLLADLVDRRQRLYGQLLSLNSVSDEQGTAYLSDEEVEHIAQADQPEIASRVLTPLFHLDRPRPRLPQFSRRLRTFKAERGL